MSVHIALMERNYRDGLLNTHCPDHMHEGMMRYLMDGEEGGHFMQALLSNNLMAAFGRADYTNAAHMKDWCLFLYNYAPSDSYGSPERHDAWVASGGINGQAKAQENQNELHTK